MNNEYIPFGGWATVVPRNEVIGHNDDREAESTYEEEPKKVPQPDNVLRIEDYFKKDK